MKKVSDAHSVPHQVSTYMGTPTDINFSLPKISSSGRPSCASVDFYGLLSAGVLRMASRFPRRLFLTISSSSHHAMLRTRSRGKIIIEQCEQGRLAALERIIKAPNNFGG